MFWVTMIHIPFLAFFDIREWSESISVHCVSVKQIPLLVQGFENLFFSPFETVSLYDFIFFYMSNKTFETKALTFDHTHTHTHTHTHASQNLQFHIKFLLRILSLEKFGTKWAAKTKDSFL